METTNIMLDDARREEIVFAGPLTQYFKTEKLFDTSLIKTDEFNDLLFSSDLTDPVDEFLRFMGKPENFYFTCKHLLNIKLIPLQLPILYELWTRKSPMLIGVRGLGKTFLLALYATLRAIFHQGSKTVLCAGSYRQSKLIFEYMERMWLNSPVFRDFVTRSSNSTREGPKRDIDRCTFKIAESEVYSIPLGTGEKIRGLRANYVLADEMASIPLEIFEVVIRGFTSVSASPEEKISNILWAQFLDEQGRKEEAIDIIESLGFGNQCVISGTATYSFNFFHSYWKRYKAIIESQGDKNKLEEIFMGSIPDGFNWRNYSVLRIPWTQVPLGLMDPDTIASAKATMQKSLFNMEYCAIFQQDSEGFFRRSLIESCVASDIKPIVLPSGPVTFSAIIRGNPNKKYILGIDPASESDNFAIVIEELCGDHKRIVYCWTVNRQTLRERLKKQGITNDKSYYNYCARKIRELLAIFPSEHVGIDAQGGGIAIMEALHDNELLQPGELPFWPYIRQGKDDVFWWEQENKPTDGQAGLHILHMVQFANVQFTSEANHGLRKDLESKTTLFPFFDSAEIGRAIEVDRAQSREYDTLEDCVLDIESLKDELTTIVHDQTGSGRDRWDTPEIKKAGGKVGRLRKDRYTALCISNQIARLINNPLKPPAYPVVGGYVGQQRKSGGGGRMYVGPEHIVSKMSGAYGAGVLR